MVCNYCYLQIQFLGTTGLSIVTLIKSVNAAYLCVSDQNYSLHLCLSYLNIFEELLKELFNM